MAIVIGPCWRHFCWQKLKRRILATFGFIGTTLRVTQPKLHSMFFPIFEDRITSHIADVVWPPRSCDMTPLDYYLWGAVKEKCYAHKPDALKDNIREVIGEIQLHTIDNVLKNCSDHLGYCLGSWGSYFNEIIFHYLPEGCTFEYKKKFKKIFGSFFLKHFQKKIFGGLSISWKYCGDQRVRQYDRH